MEENAAGNEDLRFRGDRMICPLCKSTTSKLLQEIPAEVLIRDWNAGFHVDIRPELELVTAIELRVCGRCDLRYFVPDTLAGSPALYQELERFGWYYVPRKWEHDVALEDLDCCKNGIGVGCGFGDFVARVRREEGISFEGCEQNPNAVEVAQTNGTPVRLATVEEVAKSHPGTYSAVCSFQVLEHLTKPAEFVKAACDLLPAGGKLILGLPNADSSLGRQFNLLDMPTHQVTRWTIGVLSRLPRWFPLKLVRIVTEPLADYHVDGYVQA
jgi:SAM-dependent methyltransferase